MLISLRGTRILAFAVAMTLLTAACDVVELADISLAESDPSALVLGGLRPVEDSDDPTEQAVASAGQAITDIRQANDLVEEGLANYDITLLDEAIALRPHDPYYQYQKAALELAESGPVQGDEDLITLNRAFGAVHAAYPNASPEESKAEHDRLWGEALLRTMELYPRDSATWEGLRKTYCTTTTTKLDPLGMLAAPTSPPPDCIDQ